MSGDSYADIFFDFGPPRHAMTANIATVGPVERGPVAPPTHLGGRFAWRTRHDIARAVFAEMDRRGL